MRTGKFFVAAAALSLAGGSIAAQAETVRQAAPVSEESELGPDLSRLLIIALVGGVIVLGLEVIDDEPQSP